MANADIESLRRAVRGEVIVAGQAGYGQLHILKAVYDPTNLFRVNANIPPG